MSPSGDLPTAESNGKPADPDLQYPSLPLNNLWRGNKEGTVRLGGIPKFDDPYDEREWIKVSDFSRESQRQLSMILGTYGGCLSLLGKVRLRRWYRWPHYCPRPRLRGSLLVSLFGRLSLFSTPLIQHHLG